MHFLCDATDLKQSVERNLKVYGKSLTTVLDEVQVQSVQFPPTPCPPGKPSFPKVRHLRHS